MVRYKALIAVTMRTGTFWDTKLCGVAKAHLVNSLSLQMKIIHLKC
jgi:hypothetical protein